MSIRTAKARYEAGKIRERALVAIAWHLPKSVAMWAYIRVGAHATTGEYSNTVVPEITMMEALERWPVK